MRSSYSMPPAAAAMLLTLGASFEMMHRPDTIWIPLVVEIPLFAITWAVLAIVNAVVILPLCRLLLRWRTELWAGAVFALALAASVAVGIHTFRLFGSKPSVLHRAYLFGAFLPILITAAGTFLLEVRERARATSREDP